MVRTPLTAQPLADELGLHAQILPGVQDWSPGNVAVGLTQEQVGPIIGPILQQWTAGNLSASLGGESGTQLRDRVGAALADVYDDGVRRPVIFAHSGSIQCGVILNTVNSEAAA